MAKSKFNLNVHHVGISPKWLGSCPSCGEWNTYVEVTTSTKKEMEHKAIISGIKSTGSPKKLNEVEISERSRFLSNISEFDRVLGGGFLPGSYILIGGETWCWKKYTYFTNSKI